MTDVLPRERRVIVNDDAKLLRRAIGMLTRHELQVELHCAKCKERITREQTADGIDLLCACARRVVVRGL